MAYKKLRYINFENISLVYEGESVEEDNNYHEAQNHDIPTGKFFDILECVENLVNRTGKIEEVKVMHIRNHKLKSAEKKTLKNSIECYV